MKSIAGIERPEKGRIVIDGVTLFDAGKKIFLKPQKRKVGYLFQNYALFPNMTVEQNIGIGFTGNKEDKQKMVEQLIHHFQLDGLEKALSVKAFRRTATENGTGTDYGI
ncbi:MAG: ATP-binding cassette domain-containing protein [Coprococcus sp.]